jgi:PHD/YefM family antitoxin component YafN of YafNO toxin-antitoxin module
VSVRARFKKNNVAVYLSDEDFEATTDEELRLLKNLKGLS